jgi:hypothetical protein
MRVLVDRVHPCHELAAIPLRSARLASGGDLGAALSGFGVMTAVIAPAGIAEGASGHTGHKPA